MSAKYKDPMMLLQVRIRFSFRKSNSRIYLNICAHLVFHKDRNLVRKEVEKNLGMLRSYSTEENSGNRSRQLLREVRIQHRDSFFLSFGDQVGLMTDY